LGLFLNQDRSTQIIEVKMCGPQHDGSDIVLQSKKKCSKTIKATMTSFVFDSPLFYGYGFANV
jgi:hypothetical protein